MYSDVTLVDDSYSDAAVYYLPECNTNILHVYRTHTDQYYYQGDGYPINTQFLYSTVDQYPAISSVVIELTDVPGLFEFDINQYLNGIPLSDNYVDYLYVPLSEARVELSHPTGYGNLYESDVE